MGFLTKIINMKFRYGYTLQTFYVMDKIIKYQKYVLDVDNQHTGII